MKYRVWGEIKRGTAQKRKKSWCHACRYAIQHSIKFIAGVQIHLVWKFINPLAPELFFLILAHSVYKM